MLATTETPPAALPAAAPLHIVPCESILPEDALTVSQWAQVLGVTDRAINKRKLRSTGLTNASSGPAARLIRRNDLPRDYREKINDLIIEHGLSSPRDLHREISRHRPRWIPAKKKTELREESQIRAEKMRDCVIAYYDAQDLGRTNAQCEQAFLHKHLEHFGKPCSAKTIERRMKAITQLGGRNAPWEAYADGRNGRSGRRPTEFPPDFSRWFRSSFLNPSHGVIGLPAILADCTARWLAGENVPGLGTRTGNEPFPYTAHQLRSLMPSRDSREISGRGKFLAKVGGHLAAPPLDWTNVEPVRVVLFDDKTPDCMVLSDDGRRVFRPVVYVAYCAGTRRVLSYIVREQGRTTSLDVQALTAAVLRDYGMGGPEAGFATQLKYELGTVALSPDLGNLIESLWPGRVSVHHTSMLRGNSSDPWVAKASGNFFGKAAIESFFGAFDHAGKLLPGQTGNNYSRQPAALGDTTLTIEKIVNSQRQGHGSPRTILEDSLVTARIAQLLDIMETGEHKNAREAAARQGIKPAVLFFSDFVIALGELFRAHNHRRGHRMQGFLNVRTPHPTGKGVIYLTESPIDKARRLHAAMEEQGRCLMHPHEADILALLHRIKRVEVSANGVSTEGRRYWDATSLAQREAASIAGGKKTYLAMYNPVQPAALYLLANPPSHLAASATEIPADFRPQLLEVLPIYEAAAPTDPIAMRKRGEEVAKFNARTMRELSVAGDQLIRDVTEERQELRDRLEPLRASLCSSQPPVAPRELPATQLSRDLASAEVAVTRDRQRQNSAPTFAATLGTPEQIAAAIDDEY